MLRVAALGGGVAAAGGALALGQAGPAQAQQGRSLVGTWQITFSGSRPAPQPPFSLAMMMVATSDGVLLLSGPPRNPGPAEVGDTQDYESSPYGVWQSTGADTAAYTTMWLSYDDDAVYGGTGRVSGTFQIGADGNTLTGTARYSATNQVGTVLVNASSTIQGTRVRLEST